MLERATRMLMRVEWERTMLAIDMGWKLGWDGDELKWTTCIWDSGMMGGGLYRYGIGVGWS